MNKSEFRGYIKSQIINLPTEKQLELLHRMTFIIRDIIEELIKNKTLCHDCKKWNLNSKVIKFSQEEIREESKYISDGWDGYYEYSTIEYKVDYEECPLCHNKKEVNKHYIRTIKEWSTRKDD